MDPIPIPVTGGLLAVDYKRTPLLGGRTLVTRHTWAIDRNGNKDVFTDTWVEHGVILGCAAG